MTDMSADGFGPHAPHRSPEEAACWREPKNWRLGGLVYSCVADPRVWVPKNEGQHQNLSGSTVNMAHGEAWAFMGATGALLAWAVAGTLRDRR